MTSPNRLRAAQAFSALLELPTIERLVQRGRDPVEARYTLHLADGRTVRIGTIKVLWSQAELSKVLAVALGIVPFQVDAKDWRAAIRALINHCTDVEETPGETFEATVLEWVRAYTTRASSDREGAPPAGDPFTDGGKLYITASALAKFVRREYGEQVKLYDLRVALRDNGFEQETVHYTKNTAGRGAAKRSSTSYYMAPLDVVDPEGDD